MSRLMYFIASLLLVICFYRAGSQCLPSAKPPATQWTRTFTGGGNWEPTSRQTSDGGFITINSSNGIETANSISVAKTAADGTPLWHTSVTAVNGNDNPHSVSLTADGGYIVSGTTSANGVPGYGGNDGFLMKLDASGALQWSHLYGSSGRDEMCSAEQTADGGYIMAGFTEAGDGGALSIHGYIDEWVVKTDNKGDVQWQKAYGGSNEDDAFCIHQTPDKGYIVAGRTYSADGIAAASGGYCDAMILKLDAVGNLEWNTLYGGKAQDRATSVRTTADGGYIVGGNVNYDESVDPVLYGKEMLLKLSPAGKTEWSTIVQGGAEDDSYWADATQTADGGYIIAGNRFSPDYDPAYREYYYDAYLAKTDASGKLLWETNYGQKQTDGQNDWYDAATGIIVTADGGYAVTGWSFTRNNNIPTINSWLQKLAPDVAQKPMIDSLHTIASCPAGATGSVQVFASASSPLQYTLLGMENAQGSFTNLVPGSYTIMVASTPGCDTTARFAIEKISAPKITVSASAPSCREALDGSLSVTSVGAGMPYLYSFNSGFFNATNSYTSLAPGNYPISVKDKNGCLFDTLAVIPPSSKNCNVSMPSLPDSVFSVFVPSAFTPNGDNRNDWCKPVIRGNPGFFKFIIYNRLGQVVYLGNDPAKGWDGTVTGAAQANGVYIYHLTWKTKDNRYGERKGTITLIR